MSFCDIAKKEIADVSEAACCRDAKLYAALYFGAALSENGLRLRTASAPLCHFAQKHLADRFSLRPAVRTTRTEKGAFHTLALSEPAPVYEAFSIRPDDPFAGIDRRYIYKDCCRRAFLRGAFLGAGKINDPAKSYALEFTLKKAAAAKSLCLFLAELGYPPTITKRGAQYLCYYRDSESIEDLLTMMGAQDCAFTLMNKKIERDVRSSINRRGNCDNANFDKLVRAAAEQTAIIEKLKAQGKFALLPPELQEAASLRLNHPELSLTDLGALCAVPVSKSSMTRRLHQLGAYLSDS